MKSTYFDGLTVSKNPRASRPRTSTEKPERRSHLTVLRDLGDTKKQGGDGLVQGYWILVVQSGILDSSLSLSVSLYDIPKMMDGDG